MSLKQPLPDLPGIARRRRTLSWMLLLAAGALMPGCTSPMHASVDPEAALRQNVSAWWEARVQGDRRKMYDLYDTDYRARVAYDKYLVETAIRTRIPVKAYRITRCALQGSEATVELQLALTLPSGADVTNVATERWRREADGWRKVYVPIRTPFDERWDKTPAP